MRKSFWMIPAVLLFTVLGSTTGHADTIVTSGDGSVIGIDGIDIDHTTYNVTWGPAIDTTFAASALNAVAMLDAIVADLNAGESNTVEDTTSRGVIAFGVDGGPLTDTAVHFGGGAWTPGPINPTLVFESEVGGSAVEAAWVEFAVVATPEPGTASLTLAGLGVIAVLMWKRRQDALRHAQAT